MISKYYKFQILLCYLYELYNHVNLNNISILCLL